MYFNNNMMLQRPCNINMNNKINNYNLNNDPITIIFRASTQKERIFSQVMLQVSLDENIGDIIQKYRNMTNNYDTSFKFIFNAKNLDFSLTVAEVGLTQNANIFVVPTK